MVMCNKVVEHERLEEVALEWAAEIMTKSPTAIRMLKFGFNLLDDGRGPAALRGRGHAPGVRNR